MPLIAPGYSLVRRQTSTSTGGTRRRRAGLTPEQRKAVKRVVDYSKETFHYPTAVSGGTVTSTVAFNDLTTIAQGDDHDQRLGDKIKCKYFRFKGNFTRLDGASVDTYDQCRVVIFIWHPDDSTDPLTSETQILESATLYQHQPLQLEQSKRRKFTVLYDSAFDLPCREGGDAMKAQRQINIKKKLNNIIYFNDAATSGRNKIYMMRRGFYAGSSGNESACNFVATVSYKQM